MIVQGGYPMRWLFGNFSPFEGITQRGIALLICIGYFWTLSDSQALNATSGSIAHIKELFGSDAITMFLFVIVVSMWYLITRTPSPFGLLASLVWQWVYCSLVADWWFARDGVPNAALANHLMVSVFILYLVHTSLQEVNDGIPATNS